VQRAKTHVCYTAKEVAQLFKVNIGTVRKWVAAGLRPIDRHVPHLFLGSSLASFLSARNKPHEPLLPGEFFCVCCKGKRLPAGNRVGLLARSETTADFTANCSQCGRRLYRRVRLSEVQEKLGPARLTHDDASTTISSSRDPHQTALYEELVG
jgi:hypothetical protein